MDELRSFIAIPLILPDPLQDLMHDMQVELRSESIKWVDLTQLHITLRFLGNIHLSLVPRISEVLEESCAGLEGSNVSFTRLGYFGSRRDPRVLWFGMEPAEVLSNLRESVDQAITGLVPDEEKRPFRPHLTLARIRHIRNAKELHSVLDYYNEVLRDQSNQEDVTVDIDRLVFFKSELQKKGPVYGPLSTIIFR